MLDKGFLRSPDLRSPDLGCAEDGSLPQMAADRKENLFFFFLYFREILCVDQHVYYLCIVCPQGAAILGRGAQAGGLLYLYFCYD